MSGAQTLATVAVAVIFPLACGVGGVAAMTLRSRRQLRILVSGKAEYVGGPFDGRVVRVPRLTAIGLRMVDSPAVVREGDGRLTAPRTRPARRARARRAVAAAR